MKISKRQLKKIIKEEKQKLLVEMNPMRHAERMQGTYSDISMIDALTKAMTASLAQTESDAFEDLGGDEEASMAAEAALTYTVAQAFQTLGLMSQYQALIKTLP